MKKFIVVIFSISNLLLNSCVDRKVEALNKKYFNNSTNHVISFLPYNNGSLITDSIKVFPPNSITLLETFRITMYSLGHPIFSLNYLQNTDSIMVTFNGIKKEKHQFIEGNPSTLSITYLPNKERSLYYEEAYKQKIIEQRKSYIETEFTYTFTEQDYLDAEFIK